MKVRYIKQSPFFLPVPRKAIGQVEEALPWPRVQDATQRDSEVSWMHRPCLLPGAQLLLGSRHLPPGAGVGLGPPESYNLANEVRIWVRNKTTLNLI